MSEQTAPTHKRIQQALEAFSRSPRFSLFKGVEVGRLIPEGCQMSDAVSGLTFEQLLGHAHTLGSSTMPLRPEQEQELFHLLVALSEEGEPASLLPDDDISVIIPDSFTSTDIPTMDEQLRNNESTAEAEPPCDVPVGSVPLELALRARVAQIVSHQCYEHVRKRTLGEFWDPEWTSAPFEEAMSIGQLAGLDPAVLFKKRMVTDTRIQCIVRALGRVQAHLHTMCGEAPQQASESSRSQQTQYHRRDDSQALRFRSYREVADVQLSSAAHAVVEVVRGTHQRPEIIQAVCERFTAAECAAIVLGAEVSAQAQRELRRIVESTLSEQERELIQALFGAPAVHVEHIALVLCGVGSSISAGSLCLAAIVARGLGATRISSDAPHSGELWALDPYLHTKSKPKGVGKSRRMEKRNRLNKRR